MITISDVLTVGYLALLEGVLSLDNALVLAALVKEKLPDPIQQRRALTWGIWGAYAFRIATVFSGLYILGFFWAKILAGVYLLWLAAKELIFKKDDDESSPKRLAISWLSPFWSTVVAVEVTDAFFSIDSIGATVAVSDKHWILITGAVIGILMMRVAADLFIRLIERFPILEKSAFVLVALAGTNIALKAFEHAIPDIWFLAAATSIVLGSMAFTKKTVKHSVP